MNDIKLEIVGLIIRTRWNSQSSKLKDEQMKKMVGMFGEGTFNKTGVTSKAGLYLKYLWDQYRVHLQKNLKYEHPLAIPEREWKTLVEDTNEKALQKEGKTPPRPARYEALLIM